MDSDTRQYENRLGTDRLLPLVFRMALFSMIVGGGGAPLASIALGQGNREKAAKILKKGSASPSK